VSLDVETRNIVFSGFGEGLWGFGATLASFVTVLPLLIEKLGGSKVEIGLVGAIAAVCVLLPQGLSSLVLQHGRGRKRFLIVWHLVVMVPLWAGVGLATLFLGQDRPLAARVLVLAFLAAFMLSIGFIMPVWLDWVAGLVGSKRRGMLLGVGSSVSAVGGTAAALVAKEIAERLAFPLDYTALILAGAVFYCLSMIAFLPVREIDDSPPAPRMTGREVLARFRTSLLEPNFRRYLVARLLLTAGAGPMAFLAVHYESVDGGAVAVPVVIGLGAALTISQAVTGLAVGRLGDAFGHKLGAAVGATAQVAAIAVALVVPGSVSCAAAFACVGAIYATGWVSHQNMLFETCPHDCRTAHITVSNLVLAPFTAVVPPATGWAMEALGTQATFLVCLVPTVLGLLWLLLAVREPRVVRAM
jgi:MFS family permease